MTKPTFAIHTMGCKLNFYDSEAISAGLHDAGFMRQTDLMDADLVLLNTCTVTNKSDAESRSLIRKFRRRNPNGFLVVTGCYAQAKTGDIEAMTEVDLVTTNVDKYNVNSIVDAYHGAGKIRNEPHDIMEKRPAEFRILEDFESKTRAFIKIQDGCNLRCAYCIIPFVRGNNRSIPIANILEQIRVLEQKGVQEVVITGIHIGTWGRDFRPRKHLTDLLEAIEASDIDIWVRVSSLDSPEIPDAMIDLMANSKKIMPHLHIPLQAGCDQTLRRMRRIYKTAQYEDRVLALRERIPHMCIGADVIVGFPGETEEEFAQTEAFLNRIPMDYLHVFPYSQRAGTAAASFPDTINGRISKNRGRLLREFSQKRRMAHVARHVGQTRPAIVLPKPMHGFPRSILTDNYVEMGVDLGPEYEGKRLNIQLTERALETFVTEKISFAV